MIKKSIYPKTKRLQVTQKYVVTEKLDGSNLCIFKKDGLIYFAQRNNIFEASELTKNNAYKGLIGWVQENLDVLQIELNEGSVICGEWIGMGKLTYPHLDKKFYMFAKANITEDFDLKNINYTHDFFIYPFVSKEIPEFIGVVPVVWVVDIKPSLLSLNTVYDAYTKDVEDSTGGMVEGFILEHNNEIEKYVRMKNGTLEPHQENYKGGE